MVWERTTNIMSTTVKAPNKLEAFKSLFSMELKHDPHGMLNAAKGGAGFFDKADIAKIVKEINTCKSNKLNGMVLRLILTVLASEFDPESDKDSLNPGVIQRRLRGRFPSALKAAKERRAVFATLGANQRKAANMIEADQKMTMDRMGKKKFALDRRMAELVKQRKAMDAKQKKANEHFEMRVTRSDEQFKSAAERFNQFSFCKLTMGHGYTSWAATTRSGEKNLARLEKEMV
jgi:inorganic triphosphatase YgiF